ncbi:MAG TPA: c-type cytochrome [Pseudolabrys sp.]|nr:c-type cytochrome [Pseudolabrys sp.]
MNRIIVGSLAVLFTASLAEDGSAADARRGETLAKRWCANCHIVSVDQQRGTTQAPPFSAVANQPDFNEGRLAYFLLNPHPKMPDMNLSRSEASDLAAYIATQK